MESGVHALAVQLLRHDGAGGGAAGAEPDDLEGEPGAARVCPEAGGVPLPALPGQELLALPGIELQRVVPR